MLDKIKVIVSREDGRPICPGVSEVTPDFVTDQRPVLTVMKNGGTVEVHSGGIYELLEFTVRQLQGLSVKERRELCEPFGLEFQCGEKE